jgi:hypothetical protein
MTNIFSESYEKLSNFIFSIYDFENNGTISRDDVKVVLSYIPLKIRKSSKTLKYEKEDFKDRIESQDELQLLIDYCFGIKEKLNLSEFLEVIENVSSDMFLFILIFLYESKPFSNLTINEHEGRKLNTTLIKINRTPILTRKLIASPNLNSKFSPVLAIKNSPMMTKRILLDEYTRKNLLTPTKIDSKNLLMKFALKSKPNKPNFNSNNQNEIINIDTFVESDDIDENIDLIALPVNKKKKNDLDNLRVFGTSSYRKFNASTNSFKYLQENTSKENIDEK